MKTTIRALIYYFQIMSPIPLCIENWGSCGSAAYGASFMISAISSVDNNVRISALSVVLQATVR